MAEETNENEESEGGGRVSTPFEKPFFMPVLLILLAGWFGYDGWFNPEIESILFNRVVFGLLLVLGAYTTWQDVRDQRRSKE
jgi:hypothetical protein